MANYTDIAIKFSKDYGIYIIAIILILIGTYLLIHYLNIFFDRLKEKKDSKYFEKETIEIISFFVKYIIFLLALLSILYIVVNAYEPLRVYANFFSLMISVFWIFITIAIAVILSTIVSRTAEYLRKESEKKPHKVIQTETINFFETLFNFIIYIITGIAIIIFVLSGFNLHQAIIDSIYNFFATTGNAIIFIIIILIITYFVSNFAEKFSADLKRRTEYSKQTIDLVKNSVQYITYAIALLIIILTILGTSGYAEIGREFLTLIIIIIGIILAMASSNSVGNAISGVILLNQKVFNEGHVVCVGKGIIGEVKALSLTFTKILTLEGELITVPNNEVLNNKIINYSRSPLMPLYVDVLLPNNFPSEKVQQILKESAINTTGVRKENPPKILTLEIGDKIKYRIVVYTSDEKKRLETISELNNNILNAIEREPK